MKPAMLLTTLLSPLFASLLLAVLATLKEQLPREKTTFRLISSGLLLSLFGNLVFLFRGLARDLPPDLDLGGWLTAGSYEIPLVFHADRVGIAFGFLSAVLTLLVAQFSKTYLHREAGFVRFFLLLGLFASGTQVVAYSGSFDLFFAGWEMIGIASTLFIGFFHEREEPLLSSIRAFVTYRLCDAGLLLAIVALHEWLGSTRLTALNDISHLTTEQATLLAALFMLAACGKSAQLPFSGWLARATEGPAPTSALFYGGISIHVGLFLLLRIWPIIDLSPIIEYGGAALGLLTALYASRVARTLPDAKGILAHASLAQVGLIFAEISLGLTTLALAHLVTHGVLRVWQYLRTPNVIHDTHRLGHLHGEHPAGSVRPATRLEKQLYLLGLRQFGIDTLMDRCARFTLGIAQRLRKLDIQISPSPRSRT